MNVRRVYLNPASHMMAAAYALRAKVFVTEQGVDTSIESDGRDGEACHAVLTDNGAVIATGRMITTGELGKVQRVAVVSSQRRTGAGKEIMTALEAHGWVLGLRAISLSSQKDAVPFYLALGYVTAGPEYIEAGILHQPMNKTLISKGNKDVLSRE